jgi:hypothetical protein
LPEVALDVRENAPLIAAGGGLLLFISLFLKWVGAEGLDSVSGWEFFDILDIVFALIALVSVGIGVMLFTGNATNLPAAPGSIVGISGLVTLSIVGAMILDPFTLQGQSVDREFGLFVALIGAIGMMVGGSQLESAPAAPRTRVQEPPTAPPPPPPPPPAGPTV